MWTRLDEVNPVGPADPEEGGSMEVIEMARRGREAVKLAIEISVGRSQEYWRSKTRSKLAHGGEIVELYEEYDNAVRDYIRRHRERMLQ